MLNQIIKESLGSIHIPSVLEPPGLCRTDAKRPDGLTLTPWIRGSPLLWDATVVDGLAPSRISDPHLIAGKAVSEAEILKTRKYDLLFVTATPFNQWHLKNRELVEAIPRSSCVI